MMKMLRPLLLAISLLFIFTLAQGQAKFLLNNSTFTIPDTVFYGTIDSATIGLRNTGSNFDGQLQFSYTIQPDSGTVMEYGTYAGSDTQGGINYTPTTIVLDTGETTSIIVNVNFSTPFLTGPSVVVIWPSISGVSYGDSITRLVYVEMPLAISPVDDKNVKVYLYNHQLLVKNVLPGELDRVRIYDITGAKIYDQPFASPFIPLSGYAGGVYFADLLFSDKTYASFKLINLDR